MLARGETLQVLTKLLYFGLTFASGEPSPCSGIPRGEVLMQAGVASQTLGEEYVEILPYAVKRSNFPSRIVRSHPFVSPFPSKSDNNPSRKRRILSVIALAFGSTLWRTLCKSLVPHPATHARNPGGETRRERLGRWIGSEWVQRVPEAWFVWFLLRGRNVEWSKGLLGMRYVSFAFFLFWR